MSTGDQAVRWQRRLDRDFPRGLLASWDDIKGGAGGPRYVYLCPRAEVTGMQGLNPVVMLPVPDWDKVVQPGAVASYQPEPGVSPRLVRVTFADGRSMTWGAGVSRAQAAATDGHRREARDHFAATGHSAWEPPGEEEPGDAGRGLP